MDQATRETVCPRFNLNDSKSLKRFVAVQISLPEIQHSAGTTPLNTKHVCTFTGTNNTVQWKFEEKKKKLSLSGTVNFLQI